MEPVPAGQPNGEASFLGFWRSPSWQDEHELSTAAAPVTKKPGAAFRAGICSRRPAGTKQASTRTCCAGRIRTAGREAFMARLEKAGGTGGAPGKPHPGELLSCTVFMQWLQGGYENCSFLAGARANGALNSSDEKKELAPAEAISAFLQDPQGIGRKALQV